MYRVWEITDKEREEGKYIISHWDGDTTSYTICESKEEYEEEKARLQKIEDEYKREMDAYYRRQGVK